MTDPETIKAGIRCAIRGYHIRQGFGNGTNSENVAWNGHCSECFVPLWPETTKRKGKSE